MGFPRADAEEINQPSGAVGLADALFSSTQQRVLGLLFGQPKRQFSQRELIVTAASGSGAVQRELSRLVASKLVVVTVVGRQKRYQANRGAPVFAELCGIIEKTVGVSRQVQAVLSPLASQISFAVLYGSTATGTDTAASDVDVLVVSDSLTLEEVLRTVEPAERRIGRQVTPTLLSREEVARRRADGQPFITKLLARKYVVLLGHLDDIASTR